MATSFDSCLETHATPGLRLGQQLDTISIWSEPQYITLIFNAGLKIRAGHWSMTSQNTQMTSQIASKKHLIGQKLNSAREKNRLSIQVLSYFPVEESAKLL